ncbi:nitrogen regulatory protein P-II family [Hydrogenispora ethanolica]|uniref:Nitrogen regulatory protein P-II family n=1 Tax=Hydrogenispora ethanolica TaxID=1082276 RepID=A0A4V2QCY8_HYDET|nr:P-II family nitrogen regulator [Hydrogenispora ethanolica]TCL61867.1 nitrogen regulatory protein P-II family [Hydrogenispora ethanolica]
MAENCPQFELIVTIVNRGYAEDVIDAAKKAGASGGTIIHSRGTGIHENAKLFGIPIEPEKEIILTLVERIQTDAVLDAISNAVNLDTPSRGIAFVLNVEKTAGICHLRPKQDSFGNAKSS